MIEVKVGIPESNCNHHLPKVIVKYLIRELSKISIYKSILKPLYFICKECDNQWLNAPNGAAWYDYRGQTLKSKGNYGHTTKD